MADIGAKISIDGEKQFRQDLQNITQQGKTLAAEMDKVSTAFKNADDSEKDMGKVTETLNKQIENQRKLVDKLKEAVENSAKKTGENSTETLKWKENLAKAEKGLDDLEKEARDAAKGVDILGNEEKDTTDQTSIFGAVLKANLASEAIKKGVQALSSAVKDVAKFFVDAVKGAAEYADEVNTLSQTTGMSTDAIQEYKYAADILDVSFDTIQGSLTKLTSNMSKNSDAFEELGISIRDENGELRDANEVFDEAITALGYIDNETQRDAVAMKIFGKSAKDLNPLIKTGSKELGKLRKEAHDVGAVMSEDALEGAGAFQDGLDRIKGTWDALKRTLGANILSKVTPYLEKFVGLFQDLAKTGDLSGFIDGVVDMINDIVQKIPEFTEKLISALPNVIKTLTQALSKLLPNLAKSVGQILGQIFSNLPEIISAGLELGWSLIKGVFQAIPNLISGLVDALTGRKLSEAAQACKEKFDEIKKKVEEIPTATERIASALDEVSAKFDEAEYWVKVFENLEKKTDPTAADLEMMQTAADKLNAIFPELGVQINKDTGKWNMNAKAIRDSIAALKDRYEAEAYFSAAQESRTEAARMEGERRSLEKEADELQKKIQKLIDVREQIFADIAAGGEVDLEQLASLNFELQDLQDQLYSVNGTLNKYDEGINKLNDSAEYLQEQGMAKLENAIENTNKAFDKGVANARYDGKIIGTQYVDGVVEGLGSNQGILFNRARKLMKDTVNVMKDAAQIHSPSKLTENLIGKNLALGVIKGWEDVFSMRNPLSLRGAINGVASTTNNTTNLGGVSLNVYAREGQDANAIADMVMRKMQSAVNSKKAVFA